MFGTDISLKTAAMALFLTASLTLTLTGSALAQSPVTPPGAGTETAPYLISEIGHLVWMGDTAADSAGKYYTMTADIDASDTANWNDDGTDTSLLEGFKPISTYETPFTGIFDGNGHTIAGLTINRQSENVGLFGLVFPGGQVLNLGIVDCTVTGDYLVGSLVGENHSTISNCYVTGTITGGGYIGGLIGDNYGTVSNCYATCNITATLEDVGGLSGSNYGTMMNCHATNTVKGSINVGGLVGDNFGPLSSCYATNTVMGGYFRWRPSRIQ